MWQNWPWRIPQDTINSLLKGRFFCCSFCPGFEMFVLVQGFSLHACVWCFLIILHECLEILLCNVKQQLHSVVGLIEISLLLSKWVHFVGLMHFEIGLMKMSLLQTLEYYNIRCISPIFSEVCMHFVQEWLTKSRYFVDIMGIQYFVWISLFLNFWLLSRKCVKFQIWIWS